MKWNDCVMMQVFVFQENMLVKWQRRKNGKNE